MVQAIDYFKLAVPQILKCNNLRSIMMVLNTYRQYLSYPEYENLIDIADSKLDEIVKAKVNLMLSNIKVKN
jgi:hypothetical protein